jgi:hypothetical protein
MSETENWDERNALLDHLERRRGALDAALWQAPALTIAAQAFLLRVLTDPSLDPIAGGFILAAGVVASWAAVRSLLRGRAREVWYSDAIAHYLETFGLPDTRPSPSLPRKAIDREGFWHCLDRALQIRSEQWRTPTYFWWSAALLLFALADILAFFLTAF